MVKFKSSSIKRKQNNNSFSTRKKKKRIFRKKMCQIQYVSPLLFNKDTYFYYEITKMIRMNKIIEQYNSLKIEKEDIDILKGEILILKKGVQINEKTIEITSKMAKLIEQWRPIEKNFTKEEELIKNIIEASEQRGALSCRKISYILKNNYNTIICKSKVNQILKNRLNYTYRKTSVKNAKIISDYSLKMANIFLKIIFRAIYLNYEFVFID